MGEFLDSFPFIKIFRFFKFTHHVFAVFAFQNVVGAFPKLLRMLNQGDFPPEHEHDARKEQTPREEVPYKKHRGKHHKIAPVKDSAVDAAAVLYDKALERAPDDHADQVAHIVKDRQENQFLRADNLKHIKNAENCVET